jgi:hypothetical protein
MAGCQGARERDQTNLGKTPGQSLQEPEQRSRPGGDTSKVLTGGGGGKRKEIPPALLVPSGPHQDAAEEAAKDAQD